MRAPALSRLGKLEAGLMGAHAVYWLFTHPVNNSWLQRENLSGLGPGFFSLGLASKRGRQSESRLENWTDLRESWSIRRWHERGLAALSFIALVFALSVN